MKKNLFWKIMAILFLLWLCLYLWNSSIVMPQGALIKVNKLTGKAYTFANGEWTIFKNE